mmetsp:Transcript_24849/g.67545  ORF Transcript_24849/g.67545 Transcript_24849/m.67545 type:complete len:219 (-) Transcript_24849:325-981(-)
MDIRKAPDRTVRLGLVDSDDDSEEDVLNTKPRPPASFTQAQKTNKAQSNDVTPPLDRTKGGKKRPAEDDDIGLTFEESYDPEFLRRQQEMERQRKALKECTRVDLAAAADEVEEEEEEEEDAEVEVVPPPANVPPPPPVPVEPPRKIKIKVRVDHAQEPIVVKMFEHQTFEKLIEKLCASRGVPISLGKLIFDGDVVEPTQNPKDLDLENDDMLDFKC